MSRLTTLSGSAVLVLAMFNATQNLRAHGFAGKRFFPATLSTDDPFVADELALPTVMSIKTPESGGTRETDGSVGFAKQITSDLAIEISDTYKTLRPPGAPPARGWDNLELGAKYVILESDPHEAIVSLGIDAELGGTGAKRIGADSFSTWTPGLFFGRGLGDLPDHLSWLRPLAVTGVVGVSVPDQAGTRTETVDSTTGGHRFETEPHPHLLKWGWAVEYSLPYLQSNVKDIGLHGPFDRMIPLVEFSFETPLDRGEAGLTTGTIDPGVVWTGQRVQFAAEAVIPVNSRTGSHAGVIAQVHFYLDDIFPHGLGKPLFGGTR